MLGEYIRHLLETKNISEVAAAKKTHIELKNFQAMLRDEWIPADRWVFFIREGLNLTPLQESGLKEALRATRSAIKTQTIHANAILAEPTQPITQTESPPLPIWEPPHNATLLEFTKSRLKHIGKTQAAMAETLGIHSAQLHYNLNRQFTNKTHVEGAAHFMGLQDEQKEEFTRLATKSKHKEHSFVKRITDEKKPPQFTRHTPRSTYANTPSATPWQEPPSSADLREFVNSRLKYLHKTQVELANAAGIKLNALAYHLLNYFKDEHIERAADFLRLENEARARFITLATKPLKPEKRPPR